MAFLSRAAKRQAARALDGTRASGATVAEPASGALETQLPGAPLRDPVLASCGAVLTWEDVRDWMVDEESWAAAARSAAEGMALAAAGVADPTGPELRRAAEVFRRERRLISGEDLMRWLAHRGISEEEWVDWLDRSLRKEAHAAPSHLTYEADEQATWVEAVCSDALEEAARRLARAVGAWAERTGGAALPPTAQETEGTAGSAAVSSAKGRAHWVSLRQAYEELMREVPDRADLERAIATNAAGWVQVALEWADFGTVDAAREAVASMRDDGVTLAAVAELARVDFGDAVVRAEDLDARTRAVAVSAPVDRPTVVGTPESPGVIAVVRARRHPTVDDPADAELAAESCMEERVGAAMDRWVTWRD